MWTVLKCLVVSNWDEKRRRLRRRLCLQGGSEWEMESGGEAAESSYIIRPNFQHKFKGALVKECIRSVLKTELASKQYDPEEVGTLSRSLSQTILDQLKKLGFHRYKLVVQVVLGEQRGEGVKVAARCLWDADTDSYMQDVYMNDSLFCVAAVFGCFYY
ncbi:dynein light chain Tctex-type protein 2B isoform X2 [Polypterus senegalus]|uniref:dynein light chain Tctex-type protein 2B isoform X2 n=1 Tax=Polypterus senegalus TaxID=55291 RepID=UPI0019653C66|nr:dynein light chain Tctex-type protein 2B isoform X2 [Polypterus senegalus]